MIEKAANDLDICKKHVLNITNKTDLMGIEGIAANYYFNVFPNLIIQQKESFPFEGRNRRPPRVCSLPRGLNNTCKEI